MLRSASSPVTPPIGLASISLGDTATTPDASDGALWHHTQHAMLLCLLPCCYWMAQDCRCKQHVCCVVNGGAACCFSHVSRACSVPKT